MKTKESLSNGVLNIKRQLFVFAGTMSDPRYDFIFNPIDYVPDEKETSIRMLIHCWNHGSG